MIRVHLLAIVAAALLLIAPTAARAQRYTLFSGGATGYDIVVGNNASESEKNAAKELQNYLKQVNQCWYQIYQIVKENCSVEYGGANPHDDLMERLLSARKK